MKKNQQLLFDLLKIELNPLDFEKLLKRLRESEILV
jgi:hypothetical protein